MTATQTFSETVSDFRKGQKFSMNQMAKQAGVSWVTLDNIEKGKSSPSDKSKSRIERFMSKTLAKTGASKYASCVSSIPAIEEVQANIPPTKNEIVRVLSFLMDENEKEIAYLKAQNESISAQMEGV